MQLGTRWNTGDEPSARLPAAVVHAVREVEAMLGAGTTGRWTLTWLERVPVLDHDSGWSVRYDPAADAVRILSPDDDPVALDSEADD